MTKIRNFWLAHRSRIARIIFWPYVISIAVFVLEFFSYCYQMRKAGLETVSDAVTWLLAIGGVLYDIVLNIRSWLAIFHDGTEVAIKGSIQWKYVLEKVDSIWIGSLAAILCLVLLNSFLPGFILAFIQIVITTALVIATFVQPLVLAIGFGIYLRRFLKRKTKAS